MNFYAKQACSACDGDPYAQDTSLHAKNSSQQGEGQCDAVHAELRQ